MASTPKTSTPAPTASTQTTNLSTAFNIMSGLNFQQLSDLLEGKETLQEGITTAEELAETLLEGATVLGVPFAGTVETFVPIAKNLIGFAEAFLPAATGVAGTINASTVANSPTIATGR